jgi:hypothetical protein
MNGANDIVSLDPSLFNGCTCVGGASNANTVATGVRKAPLSRADVGQG